MPIDVSQQFDLILQKGLVGGGEYIENKSVSFFSHMLPSFFSGQEKTFKMKYKEQTSRIPYSRDVHKEEFIELTFGPVSNSKSPSSGVIRVDKYSFISALSKAVELDDGKIGVSLEQGQRFSNAYDDMLPLGIAFTLFFGSCNGCHQIDLVFNPDFELDRVNIKERYNSPYKVIFAAHNLKSVVAVNKLAANAENIHRAELEAQREVQQKTQFNF